MSAVVLDGAAGRSGCRDKGPVELLFRSICRGPGTSRAATLTAALQHVLPGCRRRSHAAGVDTKAQGGQLHVHRGRVRTWPRSGLQTPRSVLPGPQVWEWEVSAALSSVPLNSPPAGPPCVLGPLSLGPEAEALDVQGALGRVRGHGLCRGRGLGLDRAKGAWCPGPLQRVGAVHPWGASTWACRAHPCPVFSQQQMKLAAENLKEDMQDGGGKGTAT